MTEAKTRREPLDADVYSKLKEWLDQGKTVFEMVCPDLSCCTVYYTPNTDAPCRMHTIPYKGRVVREVKLRHFRVATPEQRRMFENQRRNAKKKSYQRRPIQDGDAPAGGVGYVRDLDFEQLFRNHHLEQAIWDSEHPDEEACDEEGSSEGAYADAKWEPDGRKGWHAPGATWVVVVGEAYVQVVKSNVVELHRWCSPCYPGQADLESEGGDVLCFAIPEDLLIGDE